MLKVLFVEPSGKLWGSERSLLLLLKHVKLQGIQAIVCLPAHSIFIKELKPLGLRIITWLPASKHTYNLFFKLVALVGLTAATLITRARIIHLNQAGFIRAAYQVARLLGRPLIIHVRLAEDAELVGRRVKCWRKVLCIANSQFVADELKKQGVPAKRIFAITNPIEVTKKVNSEESRHWQMGFVGRLSEDKGIELFLHAYRRVLQVRPQAKAVVVGSSGAKTPDGRDYLKAMKELSRELGIADQVEFLGYRKDVPDLMQQMEIFVMASEAEPWGRVVAEAMVAEAAVVSTDSGGPREMISSEVNGLLVSKGDADAMAAAVLRLLKKPELAKKFAAAGRQWVLNERSIEENC